MALDQELAPLERQALDRLLAGRHPELMQLRTQVPYLKVIRRRVDGSGFVVELQVTAPLPTAGTKRSFQLLDVYGRVTGLDHDVGFILFVEEGRVARLEGQPLEGDWPGSPELERLFYVRPRIEGGSEMVETSERDLDWALGRVGAVAEEGPIEAPAEPSTEPLVEPKVVTSDVLGRKETERMEERDKPPFDPELTQQVPREALQPKKDRERHKAGEEPPQTREEPAPPPKPGTQQAKRQEPETTPATGQDLPSRRILYLVSFNIFLGTVLTLALLILLPRAPYLPDLSQAETALAGAAVRPHLNSTLLLVALAGAAGAVLANLWGLFRASGGDAFSARIEVPSYVRPVAGAIQGLLLFFALHLALSAITVGTLTLSWVTLPGRMAYVALSFATGFGVEALTGKLREIAATTFSLRSKA